MCYGKKNWKVYYWKGRKGLKGDKYFVFIVIWLILFI